MPPRRVSVRGHDRTSIGDSIKHTVASPPNQTTAEELEKVKAILEGCATEFTIEGRHPGYDPNLAELCRSALRGNREHLAWVLEANHAS